MKSALLTSIIGLLFISPPIILHAALGDNLISCWTLDEVSGTRLDSVVASANDLTDNNTVASATGKIGNAADFETGNNEYLSHVSNVGLLLNDVDWTICGWINLESNTGASQFMFVKDNDAAGSGALVNLSDEPLVYLNGGASGVALASPISIATWYQLCSRHDAIANTISIQVNQLAVVSSAATPPTDAGAALRIGAREASGFEGYFDGLIDELAFWKRVLSDAEITDLYNSGNGRSCSYIIAGAGGGGSHPNRNFIGFSR
jgi:hypothetical protein